MSVINCRDVGLIYIVENLETKVLKIGWTDRDPSLRLAEHALRRWAHLRIIACMIGTQADERELHKMFRADLLPREIEWFRPSESIRGFVLALPRVGIVHDLVAPFVGLYSNHGKVAVRLNGEQRGRANVIWQAAMRQFDDPFRSEPGARVAFGLPAAPVMPHKGLNVHERRAMGLPCGGRG